MMSAAGLWCLILAVSIRQLIARRIREQQVFSAILPCTASVEQIQKYEPAGVVLSGGPNSVYDAGAPPCDTAVLSTGRACAWNLLRVAVMTHVLGGHVERLTAESMGALNSW